MSSATAFASGLNASNSDTESIPDHSGRFSSFPHVATMNAGVEGEVVDGDEQVDGDALGMGTQPTQVRRVTSFGSSRILGLLKHIVHVNNKPMDISASVVLRALTRKVLF